MTSKSGKLRSGREDPFGMLSFAGASFHGSAEDADDTNDEELLAELDALSGQQEASAPAPSAPHREIPQQRDMKVYVDDGLAANDDFSNAADDDLLAELDNDTTPSQVKRHRPSDGLVLQSRTDDATRFAGDSTVSSLHEEALVTNLSTKSMAQAPANDAMRRPPPAQFEMATAPPPVRAAVAFLPESQAALERYRQLAEGVRRKALAAKAAAGKGRANEPGAPPAPSPAQAAAPWLEEFKGLQAEMALLASGAPVAEVERTTAQRRVKAARDKGYSGMREAFYSYYRDRLAEGSALNASMRAPGLPREERLAMKARYDGIVSEKKGLEAVRTCITDTICYFVEFFTHPDPLGLPLTATIFPQSRISLHADAL